MRKLWLSLICLALVLCGQIASAAGITTYPALIGSDYWVKNNPKGDNVVLNAEGIKNMNASIRAVSRTVVNMSSYPTEINGNSLKTRILNYQVLEDDLYLNGKKVSDNYKNILRTQSNIDAIPANVVVRYGVTVRRANVRNLPTGQGLFYYASDTDFDALQETVMDPGEAVAVLHSSANGYFYYVQCYNYSGWMSKFDVALTDRNTWLEYAEPKQFVVVTDKGATFDNTKENVYYQQGARIPVVKQDKQSYVLDIPRCATPAGPLVREHVVVAKNTVGNKLHLGYMPYTGNTIIRNAFKNYGSVYGWGGLKNSVDCSSMMNNIYRTVGIMLPRNADEQALSAGAHTDFEGLSDAQRLANIRGLLPGAVLHLDGHCMMYLGTSNNIPFVIHSMGSHFTGGQRQRVMKVVVSDLSLQRSSGNTFMSELLTVVEYK